MDRMQQFSLRVDNKDIRGVVHLPCDRQGRVPCVIASHGLFSSMESPKFISIGERFPGSGIAVIRFDFSGCGRSSGSVSDTTVTGRLKELGAVYEFAGKHQSIGSDIGLMGSSLGGFISLFFAAAHPEIKALSVWAAPYDLEETGKNIPDEDLSVLKENFFTDAAGYDLTSVLSGLKSVQIIQGKKDTVVPWRHAEKIFEQVSEPRQLKIFEQADHSISDENDRQQAIDATLRWFEKFLI